MGSKSSSLIAQLRHPRATLAGAGVRVKVIGERRGHGSPEFTLKYGHVVPGMQARSRRARHGSRVLAINATGPSPALPPFQPLSGPFGDAAIFTRTVVVSVLT